MVIPRRRQKGHLILTDGSVGGGFQKCVKNINALAVGIYYYVRSISVVYFRIPSVHKRIIVHHPKCHESLPTTTDN